MGLVLPSTTPDLGCGVAPTSNTEEAEVEWFYEDLQDLLELILKIDIHFITGDWNAKVGSKEILGVTGKLGLGVQNEARQRLTEYCQKSALVKHNNTTQEKTLVFSPNNTRRLYTGTSPDG